MPRSSIDVLFVSKRHIKLRESRLSGLPRHIIWWAICFVMLTFTGCGSSNIVKVTGVVTLDGAPVSSGKVAFYPSKGRPAYTHIEDQGEYQLTIDKSLNGDLPGKYTVTITSQTITGGDPPPPAVNLSEEIKLLEAAGSRGKQKSKPVKVEWHVPERYSDKDSSGLTVEVEQEGGEINFDLVSKQ